MKKTGLRGRDPDASQAEFRPEQVERFRSLARELAEKQGGQRALAELLPVGESAVSRLIKGRAGLSAGTALELTKLARIEYEPYASSGQRVPTTRADVRDLASFKTARAELIGLRQTPSPIVETAAEMLSVVRPKSVTFAMLDSACALVALANAAPAEEESRRPNVADLELTDRKFAGAHAEQSAAPRRKKVGGS